METKRRKCKLSDSAHKSVNLKEFEDIILETIEKTVPNKHPSHFRGLLPYRNQVSESLSEDCLPIATNFPRRFRSLPTLSQPAPRKSLFWRNAYSFWARKARLKQVSIFPKSSIDTRDS